MKISVKYIAFATPWLLDNSSTHAATDLPAGAAIETSTHTIAALHPRITHTDIAHTDVRTTFEAEFNDQIRQAAELFGRAYGRSIDVTPQYLLGILDEVCTFLGDGAPFRIDDADSLRVCQSFLRPLHSATRRSITRPGLFNADSFVSRFIVPMQAFIHASDDFSAHEKILAETFFDNSDPRVFSFDHALFVSALQNPLIEKFLLLKSISRCLVDFHLIIKPVAIEQLRGLTIPLSEIDRNQVLFALTSFAVNAAQSPNVLIDEKIASIVHKNLGSLESDAFLNTIRTELLEYFESDYFHYLSQMCLHGDV
ncbi:MAG: hypothetical protein V4482_03980 [Pseudomonadota bacterium]